MPKNQAMWDKMREEKHAARDQMIEKLRQRKTFKGKIPSFKAGKFFRKVKTIKLKELQNSPKNLRK